jgi:hypothetical protein
MNIDDMATGQSCWMKILSRRHGLREFSVSHQKIEHLDKNKFVFIHLVVMFQKCRSPKMEPESFSRCVSNGSMMKGDHGGAEKNWGNLACL